MSSAQTAISRMLAIPALSRLIERGHATRNALLANLKFQRFAAAMPLTRPIAQKRAREVFDLCAGFVYSQILFSCVKLDVFAHLRGGPKDAAALAPKLNLTEEATRRLLDAAVALKLVDRMSDDRYGLGPHGAVIDGNPGIVKMIEHHAMLYADLADPVALLRSERGSGELARYWAYARSRNSDDLTDVRIADYTALMSASQTLIAEDVLAAYPLGNHRKLLDVGGGDGTFLGAVAVRAPHLELMLFDLPAVAERAREKFIRGGLDGRARAFGGDFFNDPLPEGADIISLVRIIHDHDDVPVRKLFAAVHRALAPGGRLLVAEPMSGASGAETVGDAYFGFYLLAMGSGRPRTAEAISEMLQREGFSSVRRIKTRMPLQTSLIVAER
ncbi:MAG: methyltransferase [Hyphomicrobium sp.]